MLKFIFGLMDVSLNRTGGNKGIKYSHLTKKRPKMFSPDVFEYIYIYICTR